MAYLGYQIYSAREEAQKDLYGVLKALKTMGYDGVELAGLYGLEPKAVRKMLDDAALTAISAHVPLKEIEQDMFKTISDYLTIGVKYIAIPHTDELRRPGGDGFASTINTIYRFGALCRSAGIQLLYHNHDFEFVKIGNLYGLDFLYAATDSDILKTEIDTCWVKYAGEDPAAYLLKYTGRCPVVHLKDYVGIKSQKSPYALLGEKDKGAQANEAAFEFKPLGSGCQDVKALVKAGLEAGAEWFIVEQDLSLDRPPLEAAQMSIECLKKALK